MLGNMVGNKMRSEKILLEKTSLEVSGIVARCPWCGLGGNDARKRLRSKRNMLDGDRYFDPFQSEIPSLSSFQ